MRQAVAIMSASYSKRSKIAVRLGLLFLLTMSGAAMQADLVRLTAARTIRVVTISIKGEEATLELLGGGTLVVPKSSVESVAAEPVSREICLASPYRCQDRAMLTRIMQAANQAR